MSTDVSGMIECRPLARIYGEDDEDAVWHAGIDLFLLNIGNAYDALACLFGVRNSFGFQPLAEDRGLPHDASDGLRAEFDAWSGPPHPYGTTWITWAELAAADWDRTDASGRLRRRAVAGPGSHWAPVWDVMRTLAELHGPDHVRLVVWFV
ncbi:MULTISPECIES: hypothetical protein [Streptomyces]|uniref:Barstar (barnase inhibitor) domain-containing protein n=1 Tax=Streptomyces albidocamelliae TaxID=2981135 RepID=A0ABY6EZM3_9ACTN|nr:hypothetical protein [Streptomyces sp. HUAS 14-6]UXY39844.1 hypothetical protein N8I86_37135 [Streptomyces sp. HUAS 14-6]